ncbi:MAG: RraA family protein [Rhizobiaceae bacterium]|nr:RraA family protein [Rhizobiaceae bacterium]
MAANERHKGNAGFLTDDRIGNTPRKIEASIIERFRKLNDITGTISDFLDEKGIRGVVGASLLRPTIGDRTIVGRAITVRNTPQPSDPHLAVSENDNLMSEVEGINQSEPGDILVIQGISDVSNMGGIMATIASRQGLAGAIVDGGVRDVGHSRKLNFPIWSKDVTPITGKWRCATQEINGVVNIMGVSVTPGDLVVADETGVCFVPQAHILEVLELCESADAKEADWVKRLDAGMSIPDLVQKIYQNFPHQKNEKRSG